MITVLFILGGLVLLFFGGESLVRGSVGVARKFGMSELVIGLTLVGFGTSLPELVTSLQALGKGAVGLSVGNVIGSNVANILLVIGAAAFVRAFATNPRSLLRDGIFMAGVTVLFAVLAWFDAFTRLTGFLFFICLPPSYWPGGPIARLVLCMAVKPKNLIMMIQFGCRFC